jgi:hypothetical protein
MENEIRALEHMYREPRIAGKLPSVGDSSKIFRSRDYRAIRELVRHPRVFPHVCDDFTSNPDTWKPIESDLVTYLLATDEKGPFGLGVFIPDTWACWKSHMAFLPRSYGNQALTSFKMMLGWMWQNTQARRLVGEIARDNKLAIRFVRRAGFSIYGVNLKSKLRGGVLVDQVCLGISKPE